MMDAWGMRSGPWGRVNAPLALTMIASPLYGVSFVGPFNMPDMAEPLKRLAKQLNITSRHIAESGCRGPRPKE